MSVCVCVSGFPLTLWRSLIIGQWLDPLVEEMSTLGQNALVRVHRSHRMTGKKERGASVDSTEGPSKYSLSLSLLVQKYNFGIEFLSKFIHANWVLHTVL